jgi:hypothetical protein
MDMKQEMEQEAGVLRRGQAGGWTLVVAGQ